MFQMKRIFLILLISLIMLNMIFLLSPYPKGVQAQITHTLSPFFVPPITYTVGNYPFGVVAGDFTGDGQQDIAVTNELDNSISILLNNGNGAFTVQSPIPDGNNPVGIATGNFGGLGHQDLAVANIGNNRVSVYLNDGIGNFVLQTSVAVGNNPIGVVTGSFTSNGRQDLAVTNQTSNTVSILLNNGNGTFTAQAPINVGLTPIGIAVGDFMGSGHQDLAVANSGSNTITILANNGSGVFTAQPPISVGNSPRYIAVGNFMGQGHQDLAVTNFSNNTVSVLANNGSGTFTVQAPIGVGVNPYGITTGDFTGNGHADLAVTNQFDGTVSVLANNGSGTFTLQAPVSVGRNPIGIVASNFTGVGHRELAVANFGDNTVSVLLNSFPVTPGLTPTPSVTPTLTPTPSPTSTPTPSPTSTPTPSPTSIPTLTPIPTPGVLPDLAIQNTYAGGNTSYVGLTVTKTLTVSVMPDSSLITSPTYIRVVDTIPTGLSNVVATGTGWFITVTASTSPSLVSAIYNGSYPLGPGTNFPPITITGTVNTSAGSSVTDTALVLIAGDIDTSNNLSTNTLYILPSTPTPLPTPLPNMAVAQTNYGGTSFQVGQVVIMVITASNVSATVPVTSQTPVTLTEVIPLGMINVQSAGPDWLITSTSNTSPLTIKASYTGTYPIAVGQNLPPITIVGTLTNNAVPSLTSTVMLNVSGDVNPENNWAIDTIVVSPSPTPLVSSLVRPALPQLSDELVQGEMRPKRRGDI
jgi:FG-GAP-like repeat